MKTTIYLLLGGDKRTGFWFLPNHFNYKKSAIQFNKDRSRSGQFKKLRIVKFTSEELK